MLTAVAATVDLILFMVFPHTAYHAAVALTLAKLYSNSMLVILNSRIKIVGGRNSSSRGASEGSAFIELGTSGRHPVRFAPRSAGARGELSTFGTVGVHVQEETWVERDNASMHEQVPSLSLSSIFAYLGLTQRDLQPSPDESMKKASSLAADDAV